MDREVMMREAFGVREACFRFAMKSLILSNEPYVRRGSSPPKSEMLPGLQPPGCVSHQRDSRDVGTDGIERPSWL